MSVVKYRGMEQLAARRAHNPKVDGSSPSPATRIKRHLQVFANVFLFIERIK